MRSRRHGVTNTKTCINTKTNTNNKTLEIVDERNLSMVLKMTLSTKIFSSVRSVYSHPDLLLIQHPPHFFRSHRSSTLDFHFLSHYSYIKAIMLYKGITGLDVLASWMPHGFDWASLMMTWGHLGHYLGTT